MFATFINNTDYFPFDRLSKKKKTRHSLKWISATTLSTTLLKTSQQPYVQNFYFPINLEKLSYILHPPLALAWHRTPINHERVASGVIPKIAPFKSSAT